MKQGARLCTGPICLRLGFHKHGFCEYDNEHFSYLNRQEFMTNGGLLTCIGRLVRGDGDTHTHTYPFYIMIR